MAASESERWGSGIEKWDNYRPGFFDEGFAPAYFEDSDFFWRMKLCDVTEHVCKDAFFYHELTKTKGGTMVGVTTNMALLGFRKHENILKRNQSRYFEKWGGKPSQEINDTPFVRAGAVAE